MPKTLKSNEHSFISMLRIFASFAVVVIHTRTFSNFESLPYNFVYAAVLWSVPVFFMITGYIFLGIKQNVEYKNIWKYIFRFLVVLIVLGLFFSLSERIFVARTFNIKMLGSAFLDIIQGKLFDHMWYLYDIIGLYLLIPIFSAFFSKNNTNVYIISGILFVFSILIPEILSIFNIDFGFSLHLGKYSLYMFLGAIMYRLNKDILKKLFIPAIVVFILIICCQAYVSFITKQMIPLSYTHSYVVLMSCCVFCIVKNLFNNKIFNNTFINELSHCTWGIYLFHPYIIHIFHKVFNFNIIGYNNYLAFPLCCIVVFILSALITFLLRKIPIIKQFL